MKIDSLEGEQRELKERYEESQRNLSETRFMHHSLQTESDSKSDINTNLLAQIHDLQVIFTPISLSRFMLASDSQLRDSEPRQDPRVRV